MRRPELDYILSTMLDSQPEVSDLLFTADKPLQVESFGELKPVYMEVPIEKLTPYREEIRRCIQTSTFGMLFAMRRLPAGR